MKTPEQIKGCVRHLSATQNLRAQEVLQMFFFERLLERISISDFRENFVLKGGVLISSMIGIRSRTTMDMDATIIGIRIDEDSLRAMIDKIILIDVADGIKFLFERLEPIREKDSYFNFRVHLRVRYGKINSPLTIDITTGDAITPAAITYCYKGIFDDKEIPLQAYPIETILAEKLEAILHLNIATTRMRDFYDVHSLLTLRNDEIDFKVLKTALQRTSQKHDTLKFIENWQHYFAAINDESNLRQTWDEYLRQNAYVPKMNFTDILSSLFRILKSI